ncbi:hypothetical protein BJI67_01005 [Acidihalobacter aeolianus]|uniref:Uncharacterized protein n=1 Tax=Acidihalobacter aeolianus TaxID=2792603 RepID=A0A1D8K4F1_9GAMM|nr:gamma-glutamyl-gamma-aminobutyrate hydrolase family protein [Acidihalobacter aeolianus]AOV15832.1 hypothetical protein BJI67_01005 [Acidihalobacter aeolianus]
MSIVIGISTFGPTPRGRYECPQGYPNAVHRAGGLPLPIPAIPERIPEYLELIDGLILIGGEDIDPTAYGVAPRKPLSRLNPYRDRAEMALTRAAVERELPTLAICRGMQIVNVALGGGIHSHLPDVFGDLVTHVGEEWAVLLHEIRVDADSRLHGWLGTDQFSSLSGHHQAISTLGRGLHANAWAPDGVIEAFEHETHPYLVGVQWHPELNADKDPVQQRLFDRLVEAADVHSRCRALEKSLSSPSSSERAKA